MQRVFPGNGELLHRAATAQGTAEGGLYRVAVSSEVEVTRDGFFGRWREVLDHSPGAVELGRFKSGAAAVLVDHAGDQVGVVESARLHPDRVLRASVRFSQSARGREVEADVRDGIRKNISVGYIPKRAVLVEQNEELGDLWRVTLWEPVELSVVAVPADASVGVGRSAAGASRPVLEVKGMSTEHAAEIAAMADAYGMAGRAAEWIRGGLTPDQVAAEILRERATKGAPNQPRAESLEGLGVSKRDREAFSYARALRVAAGMEDGGLESEVSRELERHLPAEVKRRGGILVPLALTTRTLVSNAATKGAEVVSEQVGDLIELLRTRARVVELGAKVLTGLTSPVSFPKQTGAMTAYWVGENPASNVSESDLALGLASLAPKTLQAATSYSRQFIAQASLDVEQMVRGDLAEVHARAVDYAAIHGLGAAGEPTGVYKAAGVSSTAVGGAMSYLKALAMVAQLASANADLRRAAFLTHPDVAANLMQAQRFTGTDSPVWEGSITDGLVAGLRAVSSTQVSKTMNGSDRTGGSSYAVIVGDWTDMLIGTWGALELVVDPYTSKKKGLIEVASFQMADILIRHGESFSKGTGATG